MKELLFAFTVSAALVCSSLQASEPSVKRPFHLHEQSEKDIGYSQAARVGDALYVSGSVGKGEMSQAIREAYDRVGKTLAAHGLDFRHVVKETVYATDLDAFIKQKDIRKGYFGSDEYPAATWVQVDRLFVPDFVVEVEVIAAFPAS